MTTTFGFDIVVAADLNFGIGKNGTLPWRLSGDMAYFKQLTTAVKDSGKRNAVIMGRKTWQSIPAKLRPLKDRLNVVLTRDNSFVAEPDVITASTLDEALAACRRPDVETVFVIGGGTVYAEALSHPRCRSIYLTEVRRQFDCDTFLSGIDSQLFVLQPPAHAVQRDGDVEYVFTVYRRKKAAGAPDDRMALSKP